ncbi:hypothetical protein Tco_0286279 [Tanacetum coccineum]
MRLWLDQTLSPCKKDQTGSDSGKVHVSLAGPNPEHMDDEFLATAYPKVHENLKLITDERVIEDNPESHLVLMEQGEEKQESTYSIRSTDKVALEEFDLKSALFKHMNKNKTANRNPAKLPSIPCFLWKHNEQMMMPIDKEVKAKRVKDHKRKHDSDDDEDDDDG